MSEFTEVIEDLGVVFKHGPTPAYPDAMLAKRLNMALIYTDVMPYGDKVHIPGTSFFRRHELALKSAEQEEGINGSVAVASEKTREKTVYSPVFSAVSLLDPDTRKWGSIRYFDNITGAPLEDPGDRDIAAVMLEAAVRKPIKNFKQLGLIGLGLLAEELNKAKISAQD